MIAALCIFRFREDVSSALSAVQSYVSKAAEKNCDLILFPETCLTGLDITDDPEQDYMNTLSIDSKEIGELRDLAREHAIHVGFGFLELENESMYDSYLLLDDHGEDILHYRRISSSWRHFDSPEDIYCCGEETPVAETTFGRMSILLCGDLFHEEIVQSVANLSPDIVLHPAARGMRCDRTYQDAWDADELPFYLEQWAKFHAKVLSVNALSECHEDGDRYGGGAWIVDAKGDMVESMPLLSEGLLLYDLSGE